MLNGDVTADSLTVAAGSRMRGQADFGWEDKPAAKPLNGTAAVNGTATVNGMESRAAS